jgi:hypothetical protein
MCRWANFHFARGFLTLSAQCTAAFQFISILESLAYGILLFAVNVVWMQQDHFKA